MPGWLALIAGLSVAQVYEYEPVELRAPTSIVLSLFNIHRALELFGRCAGPDASEELDERYYGSVD